MFEKNIANRSLRPRCLKRPQRDSKTLDDAAQRSSTQLKLAHELAPELLTTYAELHEAVRESLQRISQALSTGDVAAASAELSELTAAFEATPAREVG